jgi:hypothetical protein
VAIFWDTHRSASIKLFHLDWNQYANSSLSDTCPLQNALFWLLLEYKTGFRAKIRVGQVNTHWATIWDRCGHWSFSTTDG